jgi:hypothetical protein
MFSPLQVILWDAFFSALDNATFSLPLRNPMPPTGPLHTQQSLKIKLIQLFGCQRRVFDSLLIPHPLSHNALTALSLSHTTTILDILRFCLTFWASCSRAFASVNANAILVLHCTRCFWGLLLDLRPGLCTIFGPGMRRFGPSFSEESRTIVAG